MQLPSAQHPACPGLPAWRSGLPFLNAAVTSPTERAYPWITSTASYFSCLLLFRLYLLLGWGISRCCFVSLESVWESVNAHWSRAQGVSTGTATSFHILHKEIHSYFRNIQVSHMPVWWYGDLWWWSAGRTWPRHVSEAVEGQWGSRPPRERCWAQGWAATTTP